MSATTHPEPALDARLLIRELAAQLEADETSQRVDALARMFSWCEAADTRTACVMLAVAQGELEVVEEHLLHEVRTARAERQWPLDAVRAARRLVARVERLLQPLLGEDAEARRIIEWHSDVAS